MQPKYDREQIACSFRRLGSIAAVAREMGVNAQTISNALQAMGLWKAKESKAPYTIDPTELRRLYQDEGLSAEAIAAQVGCNGQTVLNHLAKHGIPRRPDGARAGDKNPAWRGGRITDKHGYVLVLAPDHPHANSGGYVREHRLVMEKVLGRLLLPNEVVHHKDGVRWNNAPDNLELFSGNADHLRHELTGRCPRWTEDGLRRIQAKSRPTAWSQKRREAHQQRQAAKRSQQPGRAEASSRPASESDAVPSR